MAANKKRHVIVVHEDDFLDWLLERANASRVGRAIWDAPLGSSADDAIKNTSRAPLFDKARSIISGMTFGEAGDVTFIVVEVPETKYLRPV